MKALKILAVIILLATQACQRGMKDTDYRMTKKEKEASSYLSNQAEKITKENLKNRLTNEKKARRKNEKMQKDLTELNHKTSKVKKRQKKHTGEFRLYSMT